MKIRNTLFGMLCVSIATGAAAQPSNLDVQLDLVVGGLDRPVAVRSANDGSNRLFVVEQGGAIRVVRNGQLLATPFLTVALPCTTNCGERGLLGLAFHPDYANNGLFYINHSEVDDPGTVDEDPGDTIIARYQVSSGNPDVADPNSRLELMDIHQDFGNHNGGDLHFGSDGYLYVGMGDGGSGGDPCNRAQRVDPSVIETIDPTNPKDERCTIGNADPTTALLGKMLRIDVDGTTAAGSNNLCAANANGSAPYAIPAGNPFANDPNACAEIWATGLRNPYRFSFDRDNGDIFIGDVGQNDFEEISYLPVNAPAGANFGWDCEEGFSTYNEGDPLEDTGEPSPACNTAGPLLLPIEDYSHFPDGLCSITGGYRYRGPIAALEGIYVHSDYCRPELYFLLDLGNGNWTRAGTVEALDSANSSPIQFISGFGEDEEGGLYLVSQDADALYKITGVTGGFDAIFASGFEP